MASVETTTIRVTRDTHERLLREAELKGLSIGEMLDYVAHKLEEQRRCEAEDRELLASAVRAWAMMAEMPAEEAQLDGALTDEEIAQLPPEET